MYYVLCTVNGLILWYPLYIFFFTFFLFKMIIITDTRNKRINHKLFYCFYVEYYSFGEKILSFLHMFGVFISFFLFVFHLLFHPLLFFVNYIRFFISMNFPFHKSFSCFSFLFFSIMLEIFLEVILY